MADLSAEFDSCFGGQSSDNESSLDLKNDGYEVQECHFSLKEEFFSFDDSQDSSNDESEKGQEIKLRTKKFSCSKLKESAVYGPKKSHLLPSKNFRMEEVENSDQNSLDLHLLRADPCKSTDRVISGQCDSMKQAFIRAGINQVLDWDPESEIDSIDIDSLAEEFSFDSLCNNFSEAQELKTPRLHASSSMKDLMVPSNFLDSLQPRKNQPSSDE